MEYFILYLGIINAFGFGIMLLDKDRAKKKARRIPEAALMGVALVGGSTGILLGMYTARHKTRKSKFCVGVPLLLLLQILLLLLLQMDR